MTESTSSPAGTGDVQWPQDAAAGAGADLAAPVVQLLTQVKLLPADETKGAISAAILGSSEGVTVIKSGALTVTKNWAALLGLTGSAAAVTPLVSKEWWGSLHANGQLGFLLACGLIASSCVFGICYILASDVRGRAAATTAQVTERAAVVNEFIRSAATLQNRTWEGDAVLKFLTAAVSVDGSVQAKIGGTWESILGFERRHGQLGVQYAGDWKPLAELSELRTVPEERTTKTPPPATTKPPSGTGPSLGEQAEAAISGLVQWLKDGADSAPKD